MIFWFVLNTNRNLGSIRIGLNDLEDTRNGIYTISAKVVDINEEDFTANDNNISLKIFGKVQDKKLSELYDNNKQIYGEIKLKKSNGSYSLISIKRLESHLYILNKEEIKGKIIINEKGVIGTFN